MMWAKIRNDVSSPDQTLSKSELERIVLLRDVPVESVVGILEHCPIREVRKDDFLIRGSEKNKCLYLLLSGRLRVHLRLTFGPIAVLEAGEIVGEVSLIDKGPATAHVVADQDCRLLAVDERTMWSLLDSQSTIALNLLFILAKRLRKGNALMATGQQFQVEHRCLAVLDTLTGLYNERWLNDSLPQEIERSSKEGSSLSLLLVGVDSFDSYQQTNGTAAAHRALYTVGWGLRKMMPSEGHLIRLKNDQFVVILPGSEISSARSLGESLRKTVDEAEIRGLDQEKFPPITVSVAAVEMTGEDTPETLLAGAQKALEGALEEGGDSA